MSTGIGIEGLQGIATVAGLHGVLRGVIDAELSVWDPIPEAEILAIPAEVEPQLAVTGDSRLGAVQVTREQVEKAAATSGALKGRTDADGYFTLASRDPRRAWRVYACFRAIRAARGGLAPLREEVCLDLGVHFAGQGIAVHVPHRLYCALKAMADQWTVYGRVTECSSGQAVTGAVVNAFDTDWVQHDTLGSGVSNGAGVYRVDYPGSAFRPGTFLNVELYGGPDIYFKVTDSIGGVLIDEAPPAGRGPGRADRGHCARIDLCATVGVPAETETLPNTWILVGKKFVIPDASGLNDFDAPGYMDQTRRYALTGTAMLRGDVARETAGGRPVEYRFLVSDSPTSNGGPPPAAASFTRTVGEGAGAPLFADGATIGYMVRLSPLRIVPVDARLGDLRPGGWLRINDCIQRVFSSTPGLSPADIGSFMWNPDALLGLRTAALTTAPNVPAGAAAPGSPVPAGNHIPVERFALRFQIRSVNPANPADVAPMPGDGTTLNSVVVNNNAVYLAFSVQADGTTVLCDPAKGNITLPYTAYHPHLERVSLDVVRNGGANVFNATPLAGNTDPAVTERRDAGLFVGTLTRCAYSATLRARPRLHDGENAASHAELPVTFFYDA